MPSRADTDETENLAWALTGHRPKVFRGLFKNPSYDNLELFLQEDEQTRITEQVKAIASLVNDKRDVSTLAEIFAAVYAAAPYKRDPCVPRFTITASQVLTQGFSTGCTNYAIAFAAVARAKGIPAIVVDGADDEWIKGGASLEYVCGHFFVEVFVENKWQLLDSTSGELYPDYDTKNWCLPGKKIAFAKALSVIDMGVNESTHNLLQRAAFLKDKIIYRDPGYVVRDLKGDSRMRKAGLSKPLRFWRRLKRKPWRKTLL